MSGMLNILEHPFVFHAMNDNGGDRARLTAEAKATVLAHSPDRVFYAGYEARRLAATHPMSGMSHREIADLLIAEAIRRRLPIDTALATDE